MKATLNTNESGFTLLESLISLMLSSIILLLLTSTILQLSKMNELVIADAQNVSASQSKIYGSRQIEWHIFLTQLEAHLQDTKLVEYHSNRIIVIEKNKENGREQKIRYGQAQTGNKNFYRSNNNGYNEMLTNIQNFNVDISGDCLKLLFTFQNGEQYKGRIWIEGWQDRD